MDGQKEGSQVFPFPGHAWGFAGLQGYGIGRLGDERATACPPTLDKVARFFSPPAGCGVKTGRDGRDVAVSAFPIAGGKTSALSSLCSPGHSRVGIADLVKAAGVELAGAVDVVGRGWSVDDFLAGTDWCDCGPGRRRRKASRRPKGPNTLREGVSWRLGRQKRPSGSPVARFFKRGSTMRRGQKRPRGKRSAMKAKSGNVENRRIGSQVRGL